MEGAQETHTCLSVKFSSFSGEIRVGVVPFIGVPRMENPRLPGIDSRLYIMKPWLH